jgi:uncharacterized protein
MEGFSMTTGMRAILSLPPRRCLAQTARISPYACGMHPISHVLYLHGFRSSPTSTKARMMASAMRERAPQVVWRCPQLPPSPSAAAQLIEQTAQGWPPQGTAVIGSSLGGFYATWLAERLGCKAVMLNPAVHAARDLARHVGVQAQWHRPEESFEFKAEYVAELRALETTGLGQPQNYFCVIAKGDEVLSWQEMTARYAGATIRLLEGSDHAISDFGEHLGAVMGFLGL